MTTVTVENDTLIVTVEGLDKIWAFKSCLTIPLSHVVSAVHNTEPLMNYRSAAWGIGTIYGGRLQIGTFREKGKKTFWDARDPNQAILITLKDDEYIKLIIEVVDPERTITEIQTAIHT